MSTGFPGVGGLVISGVGVYKVLGEAGKGVASGPIPLRYKDLMASYIDFILFISLTPSLRRSRPQLKGPTGVTQGAWRRAAPLQVGPGLG